MKFMDLKWAAAGLALFMAAAVTSCDTVTGARLFTPTTTEFDGAWIGEMSLGLREESCRLSRGGIRIRVDGGQITGQARFDRVNGDVVGVIGADGVISFATFTGEWTRDDVSIEGVFGENEATGTWGNDVCHGEWVLRRAR